MVFALLAAEHFSKGFRAMEWAGGGCLPRLEEKVRHRSGRSSDLTASSEARALLLNPADPPLTPADPGSEPSAITCYLRRNGYAARGSWQPACLAASSRTGCGVQAAPCLLPVPSLETVQPPCSSLSLFCLSQGRRCIWASNHREASCHFAATESLAGGGLSSQRAAQRPRQMYAKSHTLVRK